MEVEQLSSLLLWRTRSGAGELSGVALEIKPRPFEKFGGERGNSHPQLNAWVLRRGVLLFEEDSAAQDDKSEVT